MGDYFTDYVGIGGAQLKSFHMGLAFDFANSTNTYGILGLGRQGNSTAVAIPYPTFMDELVSQALINTKAFSLYMNDLNSTTGSIIFGGIDTSKFSGTLGILPSTNDVIDMTRIAILDSTGKTWVMMNTTEAPEKNVTASFEMGNLISFVSYNVLNSFISYFGGIDDRNNTGMVFVDCAKLTTEAGASFEFTFGRPAGPTIKVPVSEMILPLSYLFSSDAAALVKTPFKNTCVLGITSGNESYSAELPLEIFILGNTFLRSAYVVFDYDHNQTALAQSVYGLRTLMSSSYPLLQRESQSFLEVLRHRHRLQRAGQPMVEKHREAVKSLAGYLVVLLLELLLVFSLHLSPLASWPFYGFEEGAQHAASEKVRIVKTKRRNSYHRVTSRSYQTPKSRSQTPMKQQTGVS